MQANSSDQLKQLIHIQQEGDIDELVAFLEDCHPADIADLIESSEPSKRTDIWNNVEITQAGEVLKELNEGVLEQVIDEVEKPRLVESVTYLDIDDIADIIPELPEDIIADVLLAIDRETRRSLGEVLAYPEDSAGGLMNTDAVVVRDDISVDVALRFLRLKDDLPNNTDAIFLVNKNSELSGIIPINALITSKPDQIVSAYVLEDPIIFNVLDEDDTVAKHFADYNLISAPVVDEKNKLVGRITIDDVVDVIIEDAEQEALARAGLRQEEDIFAPVSKSAQNRALWLGVNLITALIGSWVISQFEGSIQQLVALAVLMPIIASMGGNAGIQTLTIVIRGLGNGTIQKGNIWRLIKKESLVGGLNGIIWAIIMGGIAAIWFNDMGLGLIIALALLINLIISAIAGVILPIIFEKMDIDPALAGGVALTTVTDVVGYFSVLGLAAWLLL
ncbi:MAG: magnesium transporter [Arenicella sp.]